MRPGPGLTALLTAALLAGCGGRAEEVVATTEPPATPVEVAALTAPGIGATLDASGVLERQREAALSFRIAGVITRMTVNAGDRVARGQVVATLDPAGVQARVAAADTDLERARRDLARDESLAARGFVSEQRLADRRSSVAMMTAAYDAVAFDARDARLVSPVSGPVLERRAQQGEVVQPGQAVIVVGDEASAFVVRTPVSDRDVGRLRPGTPATVTAAALGERTLAGVVARVGQRSGAQTGAVEAEVRVPNDPALRSGMVARVAFAARAAGPASPFARAPAEAVLEADGGRAFVYRLSADGRSVRRTAVTFGGFDGDDALIGGLAPGTRLVTAGAGFVRDGERVQVVDPSRLAAGPAR